MEAILAVVGNGVTSEDGVDRVSTLADGLREGLNLVRVHCRKYRAKAFVPANKALLATLIDEDLKMYSQRLFAAAVSVAKTPPPAIENMPGVVVPTWPALSHHIHGGGLMGAKALAAAARETGRAEKRGTSASSGAAGVRDCWAWMEKAGCHFKHCVYNHPPSKKYGPGRDQGGGGARGSGGGARRRGTARGTDTRPPAAMRRPPEATGVARASCGEPPLPRRPPRGTDRGAGSVGL